MTLKRLTPFGDIATWNQRMNQLINDLSSASPAFAKFEDGLASGNWTPVVDIREEASAFIIHAELPGLKKEDITLNVEDRVLTISGERKFENEEKKDNYHRIERSYGKFSRSFTLSKQIDVEKIQATYTDGVLAVTLPKAPEVRPRSIDISVN